MVNVVRALGRVEVEIDGRVHTVDRPTLRQAMTVLAATEAMQDGDGGAWQELCRVMGEWLDLRLSLLLRAMGVASIPVVLELLASGMPERHEQEAEKVKRKAQDLSWPTLIAEHATAYTMHPGEVLLQPWPFFVMMHEEIDRQRAREQLRAWEAAAGAQTGKIDGILKRAAVGTPVDLSYQMNDETFERHLQAAKSWRERNRKATA